MISAAIGQLIFGDFQFSVTTALLVGSCLGVLAGAAGPIWMLLRRSYGFPAWPRNELRQHAADADPASSSAVPAGLDGISGQAD